MKQLREQFHGEDQSRGKQDKEVSWELLIS